MCKPSARGSPSMSSWARSRPVAAFASAVTLALALTGCGADKPSGQAGTPSAAGSSSSSSTTSTPPPGETTPAGPTFKRLSTAQLTKALLTLDDTPNGYSDTTTSIDKKFGTSKTGLCDYKVLYMSPTYSARIFTKGGGLSAEYIKTSLQQNKTTRRRRRHTQSSSRRSARATRPRSTAIGTRSRWSKPIRSATPVSWCAWKAKAGTFIRGYALLGPTIITVTGSGLVNVDGDLVSKTLGKQVDKYSLAAVQ